MFNHRLFQAALPLDHIHQVIDDTILQPQHHVQISQADIRIDHHNLLIQHRQACAHIRSRRGLADAALSRCNYDHFTHLLSSS